MRCYHSCFFPLFLLLWLQASRITAQIDPPPQETITISSQIFVVNPTHVVLNNKTVSPGGSPIEVDGETVSADPHNDLFVNGMEVITVSGDANLGIPVVPTACTSSACLVGIEDVSASSASAKTGSTTTASTITKAASDSKQSSSNTAQTITHTNTTQSGTSTGSSSSYTQGFSHATSNPTDTHSTQSPSSTARPSSASSPSGSLTSNSVVTHTTRSGSSSTSATNQDLNSSITSNSIPASSVYTIDGVTWIGNPSVGLTAATATITPGGPSVVISSHTFALPSSATGGIISVDGQTTKLSPVTPKSSQSSTASNGGQTTSQTSSTSPTPIVNTIDGIPLTGNPQTAITVAGQTITPGGPAATVSSHTFSLPASASGPVISVDGVTTTLKTVAATNSISQSGSITPGPTSTYTIDGATFIGNPTSLAAGSTTLTPGGLPFTTKGHTFLIPASATGGVISVDGKPTTLLLPSAQGSSAGNTHSGTAGGLGVGFGPVGSITLSDASTTVTYDEVVLTKYSTIQTPTIIVTDFPEFNSKGSTTLVHGSIIVGKGGTVLIHPPSPPPGGGSIGPPGFGGPIRPPGGSSGCPSFFGISFCPPSINIEPPGSTDVDPDDLPDGTDPNNPDDSENNETEKNESQEQKTKSEDQKSSSDHETSTKSSASRPSSVSATTTGSMTTSRVSTSGSRSSSRSISSSASSSSESCSASGCGCVTLSYAPDSTPNPLDDDSNEMRKRELAGRFIKDKRGKDVYYSIATNSVGQGACQVNKFTIKPSYPGPAAVTNNEGGNPTPQMEAFYQTATYWAVPTTPPKCGAPVWGILDTAGLSNAAKGGPWAIGGNKKSVNIDHVYEVSLLDEFFAAQIGAGFTCTDINALFDVADGSTGSTRLNTVFGQLPSLTNPDFLGMDAALNRLKGSLWNPNIEGSNLGCSNSNACIQSLSNLAVVMAIANDDRVKALFSASNGRIYAAFKGIDALITAEEGCANPLKGANGDPIKATWADAYSTWITDKVISNNDLITKTASLISASISTDVNAAPANKQGNVRNWSAFVSNFNVAYTTVDSLTFPQPTLWPNNALGIQKRADATEGAACSNPGTSASAGSTTKSASSSTITKPPSTSHILASITSPGFTCTSSQENPEVSGYPCVCEGLNYCTQSAGSPCGWTTTPAAEDCCLDCM